MINKLNTLKRSIDAADPSMEDVLIKDLLKQIKDIIKDAKRSEKVNHLYGLYFDKTYGDGTSCEQAAQDLGLA
tara:strand:+ start:27242 stop:27460 length:219 start_codon:yes stop_codon:yes gene_type:complete